jgi:hypothetical protein
MVEMFSEAHKSVLDNIGIKKLIKEEYLYKENNKEKKNA